MGLSEGKQIHMSRLFQDVQGKSCVSFHFKMFKQGSGVFQKNVFFGRKLRRKPCITQEAQGGFGQAVGRRQMLRSLDWALLGRNRCRLL